ncbi:MAG: hypothetical protein MUF45_12880 [Spirosomaceae bacterium]|jgi:hypothetical protein|nr:hypothetical protein [Spirosomataceae bacterium]
MITALVNKLTNSKSIAFGIGLLFCLLFIQDSFAQSPDSLVYATSDNKVFKKFRQFFYRYQIFKDKDTLICKVYNNREVLVPYDLKWKLDKRKKPAEEAEYTPIYQIALSVSEGSFLRQQSLVRYDYINRGIRSLDSEQTGVIEIGKRVVLNPPRQSFFKILEFSPSPQVGDSLKVGFEWNDRQVLTEDAKMPSLAEWTGELTKDLSYKITRSEYIHTNIGTVFCYIIAGTCISSLGETKLIAHYNEDFGFIKMDFFNVDGSRILFEINNVKQK